MRGRIADAFANAGVTGSLHAVDIDSGAELDLGADTLVSTASLHKLCLVTTLFREAEVGRIELSRRVELPAGAARSPGGTGVAAMLDPVAMSLRDLASLAIAVSDNAAADALWDELGLATVNATMAELGLTRTVAVEPLRELYAGLRQDAGPDGPAALVDPAVVARLRALDPNRSNRGTPRDLTRLLTAVWRDEACGGEYGTGLRRVLGLQAWSHRMASGFPFDDVRVSGKTGTLPTMRHEAGVVEYPDGGRYALAICTRSASTEAALPAADAVIGTAARMAVDALRAG
ncbi:serine hydrolase [Embleya sp. NBC_00896]|uniref:serine hydrolase n=1 Tax=Embleya sp. NBC_00896 TaxID=2975961 RepID=UPI003867582B|nr:class A beta-lactamase-related serine hydrolase [Embleya sp. NBC_00896]